MLLDKCLISSSVYSCILYLVLFLVLFLVDRIWMEKGQVEFCSGWASLAELRDPKKPEEPEEHFDLVLFVAYIADVAMTVSWPLLAGAMWQKSCGQFALVTLSFSLAWWYGVSSYLFCCLSSSSWSSYLLLLLPLACLAQITRQTNGQANKQTHTHTQTNEQTKIIARFTLKHPSHSSTICNMQPGKAFVFWWGAVWWPLLFVW